MELKIFFKESFKKVLVKKVSVLGQRNFLFKKTCILLFCHRTFQQRSSCFNTVLGLKEPLKCSMAEDYIQKGVLILQHQNGKCRLKKANDVARVILAAARGWQSRTTELKNALKAKKLAFPFDTLSSECKTLIDDYIDHMVIVSCLAILTLQALC